MHGGNRLEAVRDHVRVVHPIRSSIRTPTLLVDRDCPRPAESAAAIVSQIWLSITGAVRLTGEADPPLNKRPMTSFK